VDTASLNLSMVLTTSENVSTIAPTVLASTYQAPELYVQEIGKEISLTAGVKFSPLVSFNTSVNSKITVSMEPVPNFGSTELATKVSSSKVSAKDQGLYVSKMVAIIKGHLSMIIDMDKALFTGVMAESI
jgi:hypothetical protein